MSECEMCGHHTPAAPKERKAPREGMPEDMRETFREMVARDPRYNEVIVPKFGPWPIPEADHFKGWDKRVVKLSGVGELVDDPIYDPSKHRLTWLLYVIGLEFDLGASSSVGTVEGS